MEILIELYTSILGTREEAIAFLGIQADTVKKETPIKYYEDHVQETDDATDQ